MTQNKDSIIICEACKIQIEPIGDHYIHSAVQGKSGYYHLVCWKDE